MKYYLAYFRVSCQNLDFIVHTIVAAEKRTDVVPHMLKAIDTVNEKGRPHYTEIEVGGIIGEAPDVRHRTAEMMSPFTVLGVNG